MTIVTFPKTTPGKVSADLDTGQKKFTITYTFPGRIELVRPGDSFFVAGFLPAMAGSSGIPPEPFRAPDSRYQNLRVFRSEAPVSARLLEAVPRLQEIYLTWDRHVWARTRPKRRRLRPLKVEATVLAAGEEQTADLGSAAFFTGGVDSFYTALKHKDEIEALIYVRGFEHFERPRALEYGLKVVRQGASALGKPLIEMSTNLIEVSSQFLPWMNYHGAALASAAILLSGNFSRVFIPSTNPWSNLVTLGSHPLVDPLWSTGTVEVIHDGCEADRTEKLSVIADHDAVRPFVRVCENQPEDAPNCSRCEKCLRTMISLRILGKLDQFQTLCGPVPDKIEFNKPPSATRWRKGWRSLLRDIHEFNPDPDLERAIGRLLKTEP